MKTIFFAPHNDDDESHLIRIEIYALVGSSNEVGYVGQTGIGLKSRLDVHKSGARRGRNALAKWIRESDPVAFCLEVVPESEADERERYWIRHYREQGEPILNILEGGRRGYKFTAHTPESRAKISKARKGKKLTPEHRAKLSAAHKGVSLSDEHRAAIGKGGLGIKISEEGRRNISEAKRGEKNPMSKAARAERIVRNQ